jgi:3-oxoacyl-[acyl-carrier-protein] synthase-3
MSYVAKIAGTGSFLPKKILSNSDLEKMVETNDEWILDRTGIKSRHIASPEEATSDLAYEASLKAIEAAGLRPEQIQGIIIATVTGDHLMPSTACVLQARLGCPSIMAMDISAACSGFVYGMSVADAFIRSGMYENILVVGAETLSRIVNYEDRGTCILFGDGAGAAVVTRAPADSRSRLLSAHLGSNGALGELLTVTAGGSRIPFSQDVLDKKLHLVQMKGREVFKSAVRAIADRCNEALRANGVTIADVDWVIAHQANMRIIEAVAHMLGVPPEKQLINIRETGNTSSASIPILFDEAVRENKVKRGDLVLFGAFGAGLTSGAMLLRY